MRSPDDYFEPWKDKLTPGPRLQTEEERFKLYIRDSPMVRRAHGVDRQGGRWVIINHELVRKLPSWQKQILKSNFNPVPDVLL